MAPQGDTRQSLIESARDIYLREGLAGLSMRKVARATGVSATAIYRHFESKEDLLTAVCDEGFELFAQYLWRGLKGATPQQRLELAGEGYMRFGLEHPAYYRVMFISPTEDLGYEKMPKSAEAKFSPTFRFLADRVRECSEAGLLVDDDPAALAATIWAHSHGLVSLFVTGRLRPGINSAEEFEAFYRQSTRRLIDGMKPVQE